MVDLLPLFPDTSDAGGDDPRVVGIDTDDADALLSALSSRTARRILQALHEDPTTPSALADRVDTSLQNVQYHLERLEAVGAVEVAGTAYSEKGREMKVYAPADRALVVVAGGDDETSGIRAAVSRLLGALGVLGLGSLLLQLVVDPPTFSSAGPPPASDAGGSAGGGAPTTAAGYTSRTATPHPTGTPTPEPTALATKTATPATASAPSHAPGDTGFHLFDAVAGLPPGALFFLGGATVLVVGFAWWYWRR